MSELLEEIHTLFTNRDGIYYVDTEYNGECITVPVNSELQELLHEVRERLNT